MDDMRRRLLTKISIQHMLLQTISDIEAQEKQAYKQQMNKAARLMLHDYEHDDELTIFSSLDGEHVYE